jgi:photosystem II stability/assembly factor-like uncharacterized protein
MILTFLSIFLTISTQAQSWTSIGPEAGFFKDFLIHPHDSNIVYAGSDDGGGVWKSIDGGESWSLLTGDFPNFTGWHLTMDKNHPDTLYFSEMYGRYGVLKTTDGGATFEHQTEGFNFAKDMQTTALAIYPGAGDTLFLSTGEAEGAYGRTGNGVFKSVNGGTTWSYSGLQGTAIPTVGITETGRVLAGTADEGLYFSDDVGESWTVHPDIPDTAKILEIDHLNDVWVVAAGANGVFLSEDDGASFEFIGAYGQFNFDLAILQTEPELQIISSGFFGPIRYSEGTGVWTPIDDPLFENHLLIGIDAIDGEIYAGIFSNTQIIHSSDNGETWTTLNANPVASEIRAVVADPTSNRLFASIQNSYNFSGDLYNKESLAIRDESGEWTYTGPIAHGLDLVMDPTTSETLYLGTFAQGLFKSTDGFESWENIREGNKLVMGLEINPYNNSEILISELDISTSVFGIYKSIDSGESFYKTGDFVASDIAYTDNDTIYFSHETGIFLSEDNGETVDLSPTYLVDQVVFSLMYEAPYLYAGTEEGRLYRIDAEGEVIEITGPWNDSQPTSIRNIIYAGNSILVGLSGAEQDTLHNLNGGVWQSFDGGDSWLNLTAGLTNNNVFGNTGLATDAEGNVLVATYGQGIFQSNDLILSANEQIVEDEKLTIYPNPAANMIHMEASEPIIHLTILNSNGQVVKTLNSLNAAAVTVDIADLTKGVYIIRVASQNSVNYREIIVI